MIERLIDLGKIATIAAWTAVLLLLGAAWVSVLVLDRWRYGGLFGLTACAISAMAAALQVRCYILRLAKMIRAMTAVGAVPEQRSHVTPLR